MLYIKHGIKKTSQVQVDPNQWKPFANKEASSLTLDSSYVQMQEKAKFKSDPRLRHAFGTITYKL